MRRDETQQRDIEPLFASNQTGTMAERNVVTLNTILSRESIHLDRPMADDHGVDFDAFREGEPFTLSIQVKSDSKETKAGGLQFFFRLWTMPTKLDSFFALLLPQHIGSPQAGPDLWWIPGDVVVGGRDRSKTRLIEVNPGSPFPRKWGPYRHPITEMADLIGRELDRLNSPSRRPT